VLGTGGVGALTPGPPCRQETDGRANAQGEIEVSAMSEPGLASNPSGDARPNVSRGTDCIDGTAHDLVRPRPTGLFTELGL